ncbi:MAG TPA: AraC family transcriptional regulator [Puia sp.]|nr:AraC family transcriptional regulator [Puia sp.]
MQVNVLSVKNMVCQRCVMSVEEILKKISIPYQQVLVGEIHLCDKINENQRKELKEKLQDIGLELIDNRVGILIEKIKQLIILKARNEVESKDRKIKLSKYLSSHLNHEYTYLSSLFSQVEGRTIENFFISQRIEKAKELLVYDQLSLSEIAFELDYSSVAHLSSQFKKITGLTPSHFKEIGMAKRNSLDKI